MNNRRKLVIALGASALAAPLRTFAQPQGKVWRIGFLGSVSATSYARQVDALQAGLHDLGYVEGKNLVIEFRWAEGKYDRLPELAAELVRLKVDLIVTHGPPGSRAAKTATLTIPIVIAAVGDAVAMGIVDNLARPGGNITGSTFFVVELMAKRLELLKDALPQIRRVAVLLNSDNLFLREPILRAMESAARSLKVELQEFGVRSPNELESAFAAMSNRRTEGVVVLEDSLFISNAGAVVSLASKQRISLIGFIEIADAGGLMAYGVNFPAMFRHAAVFVDKILKGTNPSELPIERATTFDLVVNMKAAKALGIKIPNSILARANRVIE